MIVVVDASVLVAELLRRRGRELLGHSDLVLAVAEDQWIEARYELARRFRFVTQRLGLGESEATVLRTNVWAMFDEAIIRLVPRSEYEEHEEVARRRVPRDPRDWAPVALSLSLECGILTNDADFLGCGRPTWTPQTLRPELA